MEVLYSAWKHCKMGIGGSLWNSGPIGVCRILTAGRGAKPLYKEHPKKILLVGIHFFGFLGELTASLPPDAQDYGAV